MSPSYEVRSFPTEVRMAEADGRRTVRGYGLVYGLPSQVMHTGKGKPFREVIRPGAANRALAEGDLQVNAHHDGRQLLGRRSAGTARFGSDDGGLWYEADLPDTSYGRDLAVSLGRRDITGSSFAFATIEDDWSAPGQDGVMLRELRAIHVFDMGPVVNPAYLDTTAALRSLELWESREADAPGPPPAVAYPTPEQLALLNRLRLLELA